MIISPDSYNLSALQAAVVGVDLRQHNTFAFSPGEVGAECASSALNMGRSSSCPVPSRPALPAPQVRVLQLGLAPADSTPRSFSCPDPPKCLQMGAPTADLPRRPISLIP